MSVKWGPEIIGREIYSVTQIMQQPCNRTSDRHQFLKNMILWAIAGMDYFNIFDFAASFLYQLHFEN